MGLVSGAMTAPIKIYEFVVAEFRAKRVPQRVVAADTGVPFSTLTKIAQGSVKDPSVHTIQVLFDYFYGLKSADCSGALRDGIERRRPESRQSERRKEDA